MAAKGFRIGGSSRLTVTSRIGPTARSITRVRSGGLAASARKTGQGGSHWIPFATIRTASSTNRAAAPRDDPTRRERRASSFRGVGTGGRLRPRFGGRLNGSVVLYIGIRVVFQ